MKQAKPSSVGSMQGSGSGRDLSRRDFAFRAGSLSGRGSGGSSGPRVRVAVVGALLALAALAFASPASADVRMDSISEVSYGSATAKATVLTNAPGFGAFYTFEYSTSDSGPWTPGPSKIVTNGEPKPLQIEGKLEGLKSNTQYFVRLTGAGSTSPGPDLSFTTLTADPTAVVLINNASEVSYTTAKATGEIDRPVKSDDVACHFEYITDADYGVQRSEVQELSVAATGGTFRLDLGAGQKTAPIAFDASAATVQGALDALPGFTAGSIAVSGGPGDEAGSTPYTFTFGVELADENVAQVRPYGEGLSGPGATVNVSTTTEGRAIGYEGATEAPCDTGNPGETPGTIQATGHVPVSAKLTNLAPDTSYHLRLAVKNAANADAKEAPTFTTLTVDPPSVVSIDNAGEVEYSRAQVKGVVERPNTSTDPAFDINVCNFEYVTDEQFSNNPSGEEFAGAGQVPCETEPPENPIHASGPTEVKAALTGLLASTIYHLRLAATNQGGTASKDAALVGCGEAEVVDG